MILMTGHYWVFFMFSKLVIILVIFAPINHTLSHLQNFHKQSLEQNTVFQIENINLQEQFISSSGSAMARPDVQ